MPAKNCNFEAIHHFVKITSRVGVATRWRTWGNMSSVNTESASAISSSSDNDTELEEDDGTELEEGGTFTLPVPN